MTICIGISSFPLHDIMSFSVPEHQIYAEQGQLVLAAKSHHIFSGPITKEEARDRYEM